MGFAQVQIQDVALDGGAETDADDFKVFDEAFGGTVFETYYTKNLKYAKKFFADNLAALYAAEGILGLESLYRKLTLKLMFNLHEIEDDYDVFVAFETMNNREGSDSVYESLNL